MSAEMIQSLVPFGIIGLAIVALLFIALSPTKNNVYIVGGIVALIAVIAIFDKFSTPISSGLIDPLKHSGEGPAASAPHSTEIYWVDTGTNADWGARDYAYTATSIPQYKVKGTALCDVGRIGYVATCWDARPTGYPANIDLTDIPAGTTPGQWCTYKDNHVRLSTPPDGPTAPGRVYICAQAIPH